MACRGCGKNELRAIAKASAEITMGKEKRPQYLETACRGCGGIIRQSWNQLNRSKGKRKVYCSAGCRKKFHERPLPQDSGGGKGE